MKLRQSFLTYNPFQSLKDLLEARSISLPVAPEIGDNDLVEELNPANEEKLFKEAMEGVVPIPRGHRGERFSQSKPPKNKFPEDPEKKEDAEVLDRLKDLVRNGAGFNILDTPEYIEGTMYNIHPEIARRLHRGDYAIQAHVDLHGWKVNDARKIFDKFFRWAVSTGKRGVLIIHGRGLSGPAPPVLKKKVIEWLTHGPWRKWIMAYASARPYDGGAGATYVLIRPRPVSKRKRSLKRSTLTFSPNLRERKGTKLGAAGS